MEEWFPEVYDTERELALSKADGARKIVTINTREPYENKETGEQEHFPITEGTHDVTISVAPGEQSTREAASDFLQQLVGNLDKIPPPGSPQSKLLAMAIRMMQLGPKGDQMADIISPPDDGKIPPQAQQAIQQAQMTVQNLQGELQKLMMEKQGKVTEGQMRQQLEEMKLRFDAMKVQMEFDHKERLERLKIEGGIAQAEITTKSQSIEERLKFVEDMYAKTADQAHEVGIQAVDHQHEAEMAAAQQQHEAGQAEQSAANSQDQQMTQIQADQQAQSVG